MGPMYRPRDAVHHGFEALRDEAEVGDVEREVLHEARGHGVGVRRGEEYVLLRVDSRIRFIQVFQDTNLSKDGR